MSTEIIKSVGPPKFTPKLTGLAAKKAAIASELEKAGVVEISAKLRNPESLEHRIGIVFDDSGSMTHDKLSDAHAGVEEFLRSCAKDTTAIAMYPMNAEPLVLTDNLPAVAVYTKGIRATGGTPLLQTLQEMQKANNLTRCIVFSDGSPDNPRFEEFRLKEGLPVDTVYIASATYENVQAETFMKNLAERTGGIYLKFEQGKANFRTAFKYLSPGLRYMLADKSFKDKLEGK